MYCGVSSLDYEKWRALSLKRQNWKALESVTPENLWLMEALLNTDWYALTNKSVPVTICILETIVIIRKCIKRFSHSV